MSTKKNKEVSGFLKGVERIGNKLPHPAMLFFILSIIVVFISAIVAAVGAPVRYWLQCSVSALPSGQGLSIPH